MYLAPTSLLVRDGCRLTYLVSKSVTGSVHTKRPSCGLGPAGQTRCPYARGGHEVEAGLVCLFFSSHGDVFHSAAVTNIANTDTASLHSLIQLQSLGLQVQQKNVGIKL